MTRWKDVELELAKILGGQRVPITGRQRGDVPDIKHEWLSIEVKTRQRLPDWMKQGMKQAEAAQETHQLPVLILHQKYQPYTDAIIGMRVRDFLAWFGDEPITEDGKAPDGLESDDE